MTTLNRALWLITLSLLSIFLSPELLSDGMFMDGLIYAAVAKNMAHGLGSFWVPHFSETTMTPFFEHPPLMFGLEALFFHVLGDARWTERIFSLLCGVALIVLIVGLWRRTAISEATRRISWLPVFLWITVPLVYWSLANNMLENLVAIFGALSVLLYLHAPVDRFRGLWLFLAGTAVLGGVLSKGPVATFPLAIPVLARCTLASRTWHQTASDFLWMVVGCLGPLGVLWLTSEGARTGLSAYLNGQVIHSLQHVRTVSSRWHILGKLLTETLPMLLLTAGATFSGWRGIHRPAQPMYRRQALLFLLVGLAASVPITISLKQRGFYLIPSFVFFALACALWIAPVVSGWMDAWCRRPLLIRTLQAMGVAGALSTVGVAAMQSDRVGRDHDKLAAVYGTLEQIPHRTRINICPSMDQDWSLHAYFARYAFVSLERNPARVHRYLLSDGSCAPKGPSQHRMPLSSETYALYLQNSDRHGIPESAETP